ncbi:PKD domain-containing protein [Flavitalea sp.]|nr:PKD domain-containing protein [Flavitalea sp.]
MSTRSYLYGCLALSLCAIVACQKDQTAVTENLPKADFDFVILNPGQLPDTVNFKARLIASTTYEWDFDSGMKSDLPNPQIIYRDIKTYNVKLTIRNKNGVDTLTKQVNITLNKPNTIFDISIPNQELLPATAVVNNRTTGSNITYKWTVGGANASTLKTPSLIFSQPGIYDVKLITTNASGTDSLTKQVRIWPYTLPYRTFAAAQTDLFAWEGNKVMILSRNRTLERTVMVKWLKAMDDCYEYYALCTGRTPTPNAPNYFINGRSTIADVASTCGAACGYLGFTGIEIQNTYFDIVYNRIRTKNEFEHFPFYEFGRNFWFYGDKIAYKANDPTATGFAIFMGFMAMKGAEVVGSSSSFQETEIDKYLADPSKTWANTLGAGQTADLFASFCFRLARDHGGENFVRNLWKKIGARPNAQSTQDAVDNFILASCAAANKNITTVFTGWRWPISAKAIDEAKQYP